MSQDKEKSQQEKKEESCCVQIGGTGCCNNISKNELAKFLRHLAEFFDPKKK